MTIIKRTGEEATYDENKIYRKRDINGKIWNNLQNNKC